MKRYILWIIMLLTGLNSLGQNFFENIKPDVNTYLTHYAAPLFEANMINFSDGWAHRAKTLKTFHFSLDLMADYTFIPSQKQYFKFIPTEYETLSVLDENGNPVNEPLTLPTLLGGDSNYRILMETEGSLPGTKNRLIIDVPNGYKKELENIIEGLPLGMPGAMIQIRAGLPFHSEIMFRYFPAIHIPPTKIDFMGIGFKHDIGRFLFRKSPFHLAILASYTSGHIKTAAPDYPDMKGTFQITTLNFQTFASFDWKFLSIYGSMGIIKGNNSLQLLGEIQYEYEIVDNSGHVIGIKPETINNPVDLNFSLLTATSSAGILLNLKFLHIFVQYNIQNYSGLHAGISIVL